MVNMNVIDLEVIDAIIKAHPYIDAVDKQLVANKNLIKGAFPDITEVDARHCLASDQIDIYIDFTRNGHKLCAMWHYRHAADNGKMEAATGLSVYELYRTDEWEPIYTAHDTPEELLELIHKYSDKPKDGHGITATEQAAPAPDHIGGAPTKGDTKMNRMKELSAEDLRTLVAAKNILVRCGSDDNFASDTERFFTDCATGYAQECAVGLIGAIEKCQAAIRVENMLGEDYSDNMAMLKALFYPFVQKLKELRMQLCIDTTGDFKLTAIPDNIEYNGQGGGVDTTELLAATEALDDDLLVLHMGQGKANLKKEEA